jgi:hypothetical protein
MYRAVIALLVFFTFCGVLALSQVASAAPQP